MSIGQVCHAQIPHNSGQCARLRRRTGQGNQPSSVRRSTRSDPHERLAFISGIALRRTDRRSVARRGLYAEPRDLGLLRSLDRLSAEAASRPAAAGSASIAAHVDHLCYGLDLMNRWSSGERDPWSDADWTASWRRDTVTESEWAALRDRLRDTSSHWRQALQTPRQMSDLELNGVISSIAHLAYHLGAIRQIDRSVQGPKAE